MKVIYFNDTKKPQVVFQESLHSPGIHLEPQTYVVMDVVVGKDQVLFVKSWGERVLLGQSTVLPEPVV
jgi:hypothetical protein